MHRAGYNWPVVCWPVATKIADVRLGCFLCADMKLTDNNICSADDYISNYSIDIA
jgi:hypothetical protein